MNPEDFLVELGRIAKENFQPSDHTGGMTAARLGLLLRRLTGRQPSDFNFPRLKDALCLLEQRGILHTGQNSKGAFSFWMGPRVSGNTTEELCSTVPADRTIDEFKRLRGTVWFAFVAVSPTGRRFLHRKTGEVKNGQQAPPSPSEEWVEIPTIDEQADKSDARQFLSETNLGQDSHFDELLQSPAWFHELSKELHRRNAGLAARWNRRRSLRVIETVEKWRKNHQLPEYLIYEASRTEPKGARRSKTDPVLPSNLRETLLRILSDMPTSELLELRVPIRDVITAIRPELLTD